MSNSKAYALDPAFLTSAALSGKAAIIPDPAQGFWSSLAKGANLVSGSEKVDTTATSLAVDVYESRLVVSGTMAFTLPDGNIPKQRKRVVCESAASIPAATLTVTHADSTTGFASQASFFFDTPGQWVEFIWMDDLGTPAWRAVKVNRAGGTANNVVVGTTVLSSNPLWQNFYCSVTGTVSSTTTKGIPNGSAIGETIIVSCSTAATIPSGTISCTGRTLLGAAATTLGTFGATTNVITLVWDGQAWTQSGSAVTLALS